MTNHREEVRKYIKSLPSSDPFDIMLEKNKIERKSLTTTERVKKKYKKKPQRNGKMMMGVRARKRNIKNERRT